VGTLLAVFLVVSLNLAPDGAQSMTIDNYVVEGVGIYPDPTTFLLTKNPDATWQLHDAQGNPWFVVAVDGPLLAILNASGGKDEVDLGAALGLPAEAWWEADAIEPPGFSPIVLSHLSNGVNVALDGLRAAEVRWE